MVWRRGGVEAGEADESGAALAAVGEFVEFPAVSSTATTSISLTKAPGRTSTRIKASLANRTCDQPTGSSCVAPWT
jgi:hypothetical protein